MDSANGSGFRLLDYALAALISVLAWIGRGFNHRIYKLEDSMSKFSTRDDIKDLREEMTSQHTKLYDRLNEIADRVPR